MQNNLALINPILLENKDFFSIEITDPIPDPTESESVKNAKKCYNIFGCIFIFCLFVGCIAYIFLVL
jgi:hypothetical protein